MAASLFEKVDAWATVTIVEVDAGEMVELAVVDERYFEVEADDSEAFVTPDGTLADPEKMKKILY